MEDKKVEFEVFGYSVDYRLRGKYIGSINIDAPDREISGYRGRRFEILKENIKIGKKVYKKGTEVQTEMFPLCGRIKGSKEDQLNVLYNSRIYYNG